MVSAMQGVSVCCGARDLVEAPQNAAITINRVTSVERLAGDLCIACGAAFSHAGQSVKLTADELRNWQERWSRRRNARQAVSDGYSVSVDDTKTRFPQPFWLPTMGLTNAVSFAALSPFVSSTLQRSEIREIFGSTSAEDGIQFESPIGPVVVDKLYFDHLYEVDPKTGKDRIDSDHVSFASLVTRTLREPLEIYEQQLAGKKSRKKIFLALYQMDASYEYHIAITIRGERLLTAYRLNSGRQGFEKNRFGVPLHTRY